MGRTKALLPVTEGQSLLSIWLERLAVSCPLRVVVAGAVVDELAAELGPDERLVVNERWSQTGPIESLVAALRTLPEEVQRVVVTPVDLRASCPRAARRVARRSPRAVSSFVGARSNGGLVVGRSLKKGPYIDLKLLKKVDLLNNRGAREPIRTWARSCTIIPEFVNHTFMCHNGRNFTKVFVTEDMVGHKIGEFAPTRTFRGHTNKKEAAKGRK